MGKYSKERNLGVRVPGELYAMLSRLCIDLELTKTDIIVKYLEYLQAQNFKERSILDADSEPLFKPENRNT